MDGALKNYADVPYGDVSIMAPCYLTDVDLAGAAVEGNILFGYTTWVSGHSNTQPASVETSAYEVLDELVNYYLDTTKFPALEAVVIAGHSAGGQMSQRYAALRKNGANEDRVHYWVGNPGSLVWLTEDRPAPNEACEGVDSYKYGLTDKFPAYALGDTNDLGRDGIVQRYLGRKVHYAFGLEDNGPGDTRCQAVTQGSSHLERGQNFVAMLDNLGGMPAGSSVDYIPGASHQADAMVQSTEGLNKVSLPHLSFSVIFNANGITIAVQIRWLNTSPMILYLTHTTPFPHFHPSFGFLTTIYYHSYHYLLYILFATHTLSLLPFPISLSAFLASRRPPVVCVSCSRFVCYVEI